MSKGNIFTLRMAKTNCHSNTDFVSSQKKCNINNYEMLSFLSK